MLILRLICSRDGDESAYRSEEAGGKGGLLGDPGSELRVGTEIEEEKSAKTVNAMSETKMIKMPCVCRSRWVTRLGCAFNVFYVFEVGGGVLPIEVP